jgi:hypothetical protein
MEIIHEMKAENVNRSDIIDEFDGWIAKPRWGAAVAAIALSFNPPTSSDEYLLTMFLTPKTAVTPLVPSLAPSTIEKIRIAPGPGL